MAVSIQTLICSLDLSAETFNSISTNLAREEIKKPNHHDMLLQEILICIPGGPTAVLKQLPIA